MPVESRPNPDVLLAEVKQQEAQARRGNLKVFLGMAAGVGKTYAMLEEARNRATEGVDVLVGYAEPHIRTETEALLLGLEILPYKMVEYRGAQLKEFDLDTALAKRPALILVDELAHTNAPGMRHPKRWQDVWELLDAGINVYTTLNVQHLESVNDIVERITGVRVRETLPDAVLEQADQVELVDIAPEELLERFREGKVYRPDQAERAAKHFFTMGNLTALRELALRKTAQRVDAQMQAARRAAGVRTTWAASERVLVCVGPSPMSVRLVRAAKRLADSLRAEWIAVSVETPASARLSARDRQRLDQTLRLAEQLGAKAVTLSGQRVAEEVVAYAQSHNVTKIVVGKPSTSRWRDLLFGSVVDHLVRSSGEIDLHVIRGEAEEQDAAATPTPRPARWDWRGYGVAVALVGLATAVSWPLYHRLELSNTNILMFYLLAVLWVATHHSRWAAMVASVLGVAAFDLTFVPPYYTFTVEDREYVLTFLVMLVTALVISALTLRVRTQAEMARSRESRTASLLRLSRELSGTRTIDEIATAASQHLSSVFARHALVLLPDGDRRLIVGGDSAGTGAIDAKELGVAQWAFEHEQAAGFDTATLPAAAGLYLPLRGSGRTLGILGLLAKEVREPLPTEQRQFAEAFASQVAQALERAELAEVARQAWERVEAELLRNTLLSGVSHELRTPLATITGSASALIESADAMPPQLRREMLESIIAESDRMERLIGNLLDMTRMESGGLTLKREWQPVEEVIGAAVRHLERRLKGRNLSIDVGPDLPLLKIDATAIEQVLANLLDNAVEYSPAGSPIEIRAEARPGEVSIEVADRGPGLPPGTEKRVFEKFFRARPALDSSRRGIGLGLAICRGIVEAHGGSISAANRPGGGASLRFTLPRGGVPPLVDTSA